MKTDVIIIYIYIYIIGNFVENTHQKKQI